MSPYWMYYEKTSPKEVKNGLKAKSKRGSIGETWWSKRFVGVLESFNLGARLTRGRSYARKGQVISIDIKPGIVRAQVQGSFAKPYDVSIKLLPLSSEEWERAIAAMASKAVFSARLLSGEMPQTIEEAFSDCGISLFPRKGADLETDCSCPDWSNPCKHIAAVYYLLAEQFDRDPFLIFKLRGKSQEEIVEALRSFRSSQAEGESKSPSSPVPISVSPVEDKVRPLEECLDCFWQKGSELDLLEINPRSPMVESAILKILGDAPFSIGRDNLAALLKQAYEIAGKAALHRAERGSEDNE
ncbi:MAG: SWIM zinc finger family protein [Methanothrix sp.]|nr:SWIM zinc finger family protein [Methanothrix sp.]MDD4446840.1 SWIM zinc finger family protein [Methanothrix sp.]